MGLWAGEWGAGCEELSIAEGELEKGGAGRWSWSSRAGDSDFAGGAEGIDVVTWVAGLLLL
jgi:hypothetical protein